VGILLHHDKKTIKHAAADVGLLFTAYNLRRIFNLVDQNLLKQYLKLCALFVFVFKAFFNAFCRKIILETKTTALKKKYYFVA